MKNKEIIVDDSLIERFWKKINVLGIGPDDCWEWTGPYRAKDRRYGIIGLTNSGGTVYTHRLAWTINHGRNPKPGMEICHTCDNPSCCNPAHLFEATHKENMEDYSKKRRAWFIEATVNGVPQENPSYAQVSTGK